MANEINVLNEIKNNDYSKVFEKHPNAILYTDNGLGDFICLTTKDNVAKLDKMGKISDYHEAKSGWYFPMWNGKDNFDKLIYMALEAEMELVPVSSNESCWMQPDEVMKFADVSLSK